MTKPLEQEDIKNALLNVMADLKEAGARNEAILASIADGVIVVNRSGIIILMNQTAEKLLGWTINESVGKKWFEILKREDEKGHPIPPEKGAIKAALSSTTTTTAAAISSYYVRKDGTKFPVARAISPIILEKKVIGAVNVFRDITSEKELDKMKDEFMDIAAHDLRTPAAAIRGFISRVLDGDAGEISAKAKELLNEAYEGNLRLISLVEDFLVVSRLERGKIIITPQPGDLAQTIETSVNGLLGLAKSKGLTLKYQKAKLPACLFDEERTIQVINNLIGNAIKYTEKGGITVWHQMNKDKVITNITDTGIGIASKIQEQLFQKYYKGDKSISRSGLGLGLYISKLCIEGMAGKIWVKSEEGKGSTFSFSLPIAK
jgi:PAS domain S-box-containing protein